ncbi:MAG: T9SS type A sorting domain-containing protein [Bacteroidetes bacterium]|nr:T9SS type A sorting domain-containing protein [Bacteroidota bacterium]
MGRMILYVTLLIVFIFPLASGEIADSVRQGEVVWRFSEARPVGQFANGDWWVLAPVTITEILPEYKKITDSVDLYPKIRFLTFYVNGWEVNPIANQYKHGFDGALYYNDTDPSKSYFDSTLVPKLPYTVTVGAVDSSGGAVSIVKAVSNLTKDPGRNYLPFRRIRSAKVLTVVSRIPEGNGAKLFRPPYVKGEKPFYSVDSIRWDRLPSYQSPVSNPPTLDTIWSLFSKVGLAHARAVRLMLPVDAYVSDYQPGNCPSINEALLRLMLNDKTNEQKKPALIAVLQRGIDMIHWQMLGNVHPESGHQPGLLAIPTFTAALLEVSKYKVFVKTLAQVLGNERYTRKDFHEDCMLHPSSWNPNLILWGEVDTEDKYWEYIIKGTGNRSIKDPYGFIDGGKSPEPSYQAICINGYKGEALCAHLMPAMRDVWDDSVYIKLIKYVDRMVQLGKWTQPDPCAPAEGKWRGSGPKNGLPCTSAMPSPVNGDTCILSYGNYRKTFGPDPNNPGKCLCDTDSSDGIGRFPYVHGNQMGWQYKSKFVDTMWAVYRKVSAPPTKVERDELLIVDGAIELFQNYPNPFNPKTLIRYEVPEKSWVVMKVFDLLGREIVTLVNGIKEPGVYEVEFNAENLASGVYIYRLVGGNNVSVKKMSVVK